MELKYQPPAADFDQIKALFSKALDACSTVYSDRKRYDHCFFFRFPQEKMDQLKELLEKSSSRTDCSFEDSSSADDLFAYLLKNPQTIVCFWSDRNETETYELLNKLHFLHGSIQHLIVMVGSQPRDELKQLYPQILIDDFLSSSDGLNHSVDYLGSLIDLSRSGISPRQWIVEFRRNLFQASQTGMKSKITRMSSFVKSQNLDSKSLPYLEFEALLGDFILQEKTPNQCLEAIDKLNYTIKATSLYLRLELMIAIAAEDKDRTKICYEKIFAQFPSMTKYEHLMFKQFLFANKDKKRTELFWKAFYSLPNWTEHPYMTHLHAMSFKLKGDEKKWIQTCVHALSTNPYPLNSLIEGLVKGLNQGKLYQQSESILRDLLELPQFRTFESMRLLYEVYIEADMKRAADRIMHRIEEDYHHRAEELSGTGKNSQSSLPKAS